MKNMLTSGKRKKAIARAVVRQGTGIIRINSLLLDNVSPKMAMLKMKEPLIIAEELAGKVNIDVTINGGGISSQADAGRIAIAKALVSFSKNDKLKEIFLSYDRNMLVADVRRKEPSKPNRHGKARAKVQKSYR